METTFQRISAVIAVAGGLFFSVAAAQDFPSKPIHLIVPYGAGGPTDGLARKLADGLQKRLQQTVIVENKPGGGSILGVDYVAKSPADGYVILFATGAPFVINPSLNANLPYKVQDFASIATVANYSMVLATAIESPFDNVRTLLQHARLHPGAVSYASAGIGTSNHLAGELLAKTANVSIAAMRPP